MAIQKNNSARNTNGNKPTLNLTGATIQAAYQLSDTVISFTLNIPGASLRGMRLVEKKDGGYFVTNPQTKGKDDKYHDLFIIYLSDDDEKRVIDTVLKNFAEKGEKRDFTTRYEV